MSLRSPIHSANLSNGSLKCSWQTSSIRSSLSGSSTNLLESWSNDCLFRLISRISPRSSSRNTNVAFFPSNSTFTNSNCSNNSMLYCLLFDRIFNIVLIHKHFYQLIILFIIDRHYKGLFNLTVLLFGWSGFLQFLFPTLTFAYDVHGDGQILRIHVFH